MGEGARGRIGEDINRDTPLLSFRAKRSEDPESMDSGSGPGVTKIYGRSGSYYKVLTIRIPGFGLRAWWIILR